MGEINAVAAPLGAALVLLAMAACQFDTSGIGRAAPGDAGGAIVPMADATPASTPDAGPPVIDEVDAAPMPQPEPGVLRARAVSPPPVLDGYADDWAGSHWVELDLASAAQRSIFNPNYGTATASMRVAAAYDAAFVYLFIEVRDDVLVFDSERLLYEDDAVHLYIDGNGDRSGPYASDDHDLVLRGDGMYFDFASEARDLELTGKHRITATGYIYEIGIARASIAATIESSLGINLGLSDDDALDDPPSPMPTDGTEADAYGLWYLRPAPRCQSCCVRYDGGPWAWCDTTLHGLLILE